MVGLGGSYARLLGGKHERLKRHKGILEVAFLNKMGIILDGVTVESVPSYIASGVQFHTIR